MVTGQDGGGFRDTNLRARVDSLCRAAGTFQGQGQGGNVGWDRWYIRV